MPDDVKKPDLANLDTAELMDEDDHNAPVPGQKHKLYELDGLPVRFTGNDPRQFPERWNPKKKQWETFTGLTRIAFEGQPMDKAEFNQLRDRVGASE